MIIIEIAGFLGADPEERFTAAGKRVVSLRVATRIRHNGQDETIWWRVSVWGDRFDKMLPYFKKGSSIIVIGEMGKPESYVAKDGTTQISMNLTAEMIKFSPFGKGDNSSSTQPVSQTNTAPAAPAAPQAQEQQYATFGAAGASEENAVTGDDLPF